jgi:hypothetical protein
MQSILSKTLNGRQSVTFCLAFRQFTRCLNGIKQFKLFYISCPKYIYLYMYVHVKIEVTYTYLEHVNKQVF